MDLIDPIKISEILPQLITLGSIGVPVALLSVLVAIRVTVTLLKKFTK